MSNKVQTPCSRSFYTPSNIKEISRTGENRRKPCRYARMSWSLFGSSICMSTFSGLTCFCFPLSTVGGLRSLIVALHGDLFIGFQYKPQLGKVLTLRNAKEFGALQEHNGDHKSIVDLCVKCTLLRAIKVRMQHHYVFCFLLCKSQFVSRIFNKALGRHKW